MKPITDIVAKYQPLFKDFDAKIAALKELAEIKRTQIEPITNEHSRLRTEYGTYVPRNPTDAQKTAVDKLRTMLLKQTRLALDDELRIVENNLNALAAAKVTTYRAFEAELDEALACAVSELKHDDLIQIHTDHLNLLLQKKARHKHPLVDKHGAVDVVPKGKQAADIVALLCLLADGTQAEERRDVD